MTTDPSMWKIFIPETLLLLFTLFYQLIPVVIWQKLLVISSPIFSTLLFTIGFSIFESVIFCHVWDWCKPVFSINNKRYEEKPAEWSVGIGIFFFCYLFIHCICVLFGAALTAYVKETATWALLVTCLIVVPYICVFGSAINPLYRVLICGKFSNQIERFLYFQSVGVIVGSWASAAVIPLDWDRDWQVWPIPGILGCLTGFVVAVIAHCILTFREMKSFRKLS